MSAGKTHRSGYVEYNGKAIQERSEYIAATAAKVNFNRMVCQCDGTLKIFVRIITPLTHATSDLEVGITSDDNSIMTVYDIQNLAAGYHDLSGVAEIVSLAVNRGDVVMWSLTGGDTTGALMAQTILISS